MARNKKSRKLAPGLIFLIVLLVIGGVTGIVLGIVLGGKKDNDGSGSKSCSPPCKSGETCENGKCTGGSKSCSPPCKSGETCENGKCTMTCFVCDKSSNTCNPEIPPKGGSCMSKSVCENDCVIPTKLIRYKLSNTTGLCIEDTSGEYLDDSCDGKGLKIGDGIIYENNPKDPASAWCPSPSCIGCIKEVDHINNEITLCTRVDTDDPKCTSASHQKCSDQTPCYNIRKNTENITNCPSMAPGLTIEYIQKNLPDCSGLEFSCSSHNPTPSTQLIFKTIEECQNKFPNTPTNWGSCIKNPSSFMKDFFLGCEKDSDCPDKRRCLPSSEGNIQSLNGKTCECDSNDQCNFPGFSSNYCALSFSPDDHQGPGKYPCNKIVN